MHAVRLLKLADNLDTVLKETFQLTECSCGTTACAIGHAARMPEFKSLGLFLTSEESNSAKDLVPEYMHHLGWSAVQEFFDLDMWDCLYLFSSNRYKWDDVKNPKAVADRIRDYVVSRGKKSGV